MNMRTRAQFKAVQQNAHPMVMKDNVFEWCMSYGRYRTFSRFLRTRHKSKREHDWTFRTMRKAVVFIKNFEAMAKKNKYDIETYELLTQSGTE